jgi:hypothetical protein
MSNHKTLCVHEIFYTKPCNLQNQSFKRNLKFKNKIHREYELLIFLQLVLLIICRNYNFGLTTKVRAYKSAGQEGGPGGTSYTPGSARECERLNLHTPK